MTLYFSFEFSDSDFEEKGWERPITTFKFSINPTIVYNSPEWDEWYDSIMLEQTGEFEEYGVHDFTGYSEDGDEYFGYYTYEVKQHQWDELMMKWHEWFSVQGFEPGKIEINVNEVDEGN